MLKSSEAEDIKYKNYQLFFMRFTIKLEESEEGGYTAQCLEIPAAISEGDTKEEVLENIKEAIQLILEVTGEQAQVLGEIATVEVSVG
jgi:predicted RNase H-like HicB family nuclease